MRGPAEKKLISDCLLRTTRKAGHGHLPGLSLSLQEASPVPAPDTSSQLTLDLLVSGINSDKGTRMKDAISVSLDFWES